MKNEDSDNWLVSTRKELGLTQEAVAEALSVTTRTVINWEGGHHEPKLTIRQVKALCKLLGKPIDEIPDTFPRKMSVAAGSNSTDALNKGGELN